MSPHREFWRNNLVGVPGERPNLWVMGQSVKDAVDTTPLTEPGSAICAPAKPTAYFLPYAAAIQ